jgi:hypothetical protein
VSRITHAILTALTLLSLSVTTDTQAQALPPPSDSPTTPPSVGLRPITERPDDPAPSTPDPAFTPELADQTPLRDGSLTFGRTSNRALPVRSAFLLQSLQTGNDDLLTSLARRARAGYAYDAELEPIFSDRANIDLATNNPGDHTESHFTLTNFQIAQGVYFRTDGVGRAFSADRRYTTLSAEAYFSLGANAGMSLGFDLVRTGLPDEDITALMDEGLFARFIIGF